MEEVTARRKQLRLVHHYTCKSDGRVRFRCKGCSFSLYAASTTRGTYLLLARTANAEHKVGCDRRGRRQAKKVRMEG